MAAAAEKLRGTEAFQVARIRDPFVENYNLLLVTDKAVSKGLSMDELFKMRGRGGKVIAAGDDENDISLLQAADVKIAMSHAPECFCRAAPISSRRRLRSRNHTSFRNGDSKWMI